MTNPKRILQIHAVDHCNNHCRDCNTLSLHAKRREYQAEEYFAALDVVYNKDWFPKYLVMLGGEPFLHSDLTMFCQKLVHRYPKAKMSTTTNGFWLSERNLIKYEKLFMMLSRFVVSIYPNLYAKINKEIPVEKLEEVIRALYPHLQHVEIRDARGANQFRLANYDHFPQQIENMRPGCQELNCAALLPDGRLCRCATAAHGPPCVPQLRPIAQGADTFLMCTNGRKTLVNGLSGCRLTDAPFVPFSGPNRVRGARMPRSLFVRNGKTRHWRVSKLCLENEVLCGSCRPLHDAGGRR